MSRAEERVKSIKQFLSTFWWLEHIEISQWYHICYSADEIIDKFDDLFFCGWVNNPKKWWVERHTRKTDIWKKNYFAIDVDLRKQYASINWCDFKDVSDEAIFQQINSIKDMLSWDPLLSQWRYITFTWNWCHVYFVWDLIEISPEDYQDWVKEIYRSWNMYTDNIRWEFNYYFADNSTANIDRILRVPYSFNTKESNPWWKKKVQIMYEQDVKSEMVWKLKEYAERYREFMKKNDKTEYKKESTVKVDNWFMTAFVERCNQLEIRDVLNKLWIRYSWHSVYEWDRKTNWWKIWNNWVFNFSDDSSDYDRAVWRPYSFVKKYLRHSERKETINRFKENFKEIAKWAEENWDKFKKEDKKEDEFVVPEVRYDSSSTAYKLADPIFDELWCMYKWDIVTIVAEWNSWKTTFALDICRRNEAEWHKCFYLNLEFWLETTFQRRWQELHWLNKIELTQISALDRENLNKYVQQCLAWINHDSRKDITLDELKVLLVDLWKQWYELVIIDTFSKIEGNMWNNARWFQNKCMSELEDLAKKTGLVIVSLHHTNKLKKFSWSQKIYDLSKVFYTISVVDETTRKYICEKDKFGCTWKEVDAMYKAWEYSLYEPPF